MVAGDTRCSLIELVFSFASLDPLSEQWQILWKIVIECNGWRWKRGHGTQSTTECGKEYFKSYELI
uniref:Uncharacterized protein n=1 Tax=Lepeophtheirus salmonis TaxID=72036 RepID=A0A0K2UQG2_LEPSM